MTRRYRVALHPAARIDLLHLRRRLTQDVGAKPALRRLRDIRFDLAALGRGPRDGTLGDTGIPGLRAMLAGGHALVTFRVDDDTRRVFVVSVTWTGLS